MILAKGDNEIRDAIGDMFDFHYLPSIVVAYVGVEVLAKSKSSIRTAFHFRFPLSELVYDFHDFDLQDFLLTSFVRIRAKLGNLSFFSLLMSIEAIPLHYRKVLFQRYLT